MIAIIPARGGSKRLKDKNIYPLLGKPLLAYSIEACLKSECISTVVVSSDNTKILNVAEEYGAMTHMRRSEHADDATPKIIAVRAIVADLAVHMDFEEVAVVQANSPELSAMHLDGAYAMFHKHKLWEVMSADENGVQNAAFRILKREVVFQEFLSAHCGFFVCNIMDVHTIDDVQKLEERLS